MDPSLDTGRVNLRKFSGTVIHHAAPRTERAHPVAMVSTSLRAPLMAGSRRTLSSSITLGATCRATVLVAAVAAAAHVEDRLAPAAPDLDGDVISATATNWTRAQLRGRRFESVRWPQLLDDMKGPVAAGPFSLSAVLPCYGGSTADATSRPRASDFPGFRLPLTESSSS